MTNFKFKLTILSLLLSNLLGAQTSIENVCEGASNNIYKLLKKADIPAGSKIAVLFFEGQSGSSNNIKTPLGIRISNKLSGYIAKKISQKEFTILMPENTEEKKYFSPPTTASEENEFYKKFNENQRPDFFIAGKYHISSDYTTITLTDMVMTENVYLLDKSGKSFGFLPYNSPILPTDKEEIKNLHIEYSADDDFMNKILQFSESTDDLFSFTVIDAISKIQITENDKLIIGKDYAIKVEIKSPCYLYAFLYTPEDKEHPHLIPLYPYVNGSSKLFTKGIYELDGTITVEPPVGNTYIKIITCINPLLLNISSIPVTINNQKIFDTSINQQDAEIFITSLKSSVKQKIPVTTQLKTYKIDYK